MKNLIYSTLLISSVALTGCANNNIFGHKEVKPEIVTINKVVSEYGLPEVYVTHNNTRYVNIKTKEYAEIIVTKRQREENKIAEEKSKGLFAQ